MTTPVIELKNVSKSFGNNQILNDINLKIEQNDSLTIIGPGGSGKTVLMKIIAQIYPPDSGDVYYYGRKTSDMTDEEIHKLKQITGMSFQNYALFDSMTVRENIGFFLDYHTDTTDAEVSRRVTENLSMVRLKNVEHQKPSELSGGMKKRVGIARAILHRPKIVFLDEPTAGLDPVTTDAISKMINKLQTELSMTLISVTNDMICARSLGNKLAMLYDGKIYKVGNREEIWESDDPLLKQFIGGHREGPIKYHEKI